MITRTSQFSDSSTLQKRFRCTIGFVMEGKTDQTSTPARQAGRFVLLVQASEARPARLLEGLHKRKAQVRVVHDAASAMVEIARFKAQVIIIHQADRITALESLLAAIRLYHPSTICWRHEPAKGDQRERLLPFACELKYNPPQASSSSAGSSTNGASEGTAFEPRPGEPRNASQAGNGHHNGNGHSQSMASAMHPSEFARRLSTNWQSGAADDLSAGPLLSAEEIELLRGPAEGNEMGLRGV